MTNDLRRRMACALISIAACAVVFSRTASARFTDLDQDGIDDDDEQAWASSMVPSIHWHSDEDCPGPYPRPILFRARYPSIDGNVRYDYLLISYVQLYYQDCGFFAGHEGDNESFEVLAHWSGSGWEFNNVSAVAHWDAALCETVTSSTGQDVWVGKTKHGTYTSPDECGCFGSDHCDDPGSSHDVTLYNVGEYYYQRNNNLEDIDEYFYDQHVWDGSHFLEAGVIRDQLFHEKYYQPDIWVPEAYTSCSSSCDYSSYEMCQSPPDPETWYWCQDYLSGLRTCEAGCEDQAFRSFDYCEPGMCY